MPRRVSFTQRERLYTRSCEHPRHYPGEPRGYLDWFDWAEEKSKTHDQKLCPHCGLYVVWVERGVGESKREVFEVLLAEWTEKDIALDAEFGCSGDAVTPIEERQAEWRKRYEEATDG